MSTKLYPPQIAGALPAFCKTYDVLSDLSLGAKMTIPFTMNEGVGEAQVKGFALRLKTASSNKYICPVIYSTNWDKEKSTITFEIGKEYSDKLNEGQFYKIQIAYYDYPTTIVINPTTGEMEETVMDSTNSNDFIIGYYSTVGIIKCISKPKISIGGYTSDSVNLFTGTFLGIYDQKESPDKTEKVYSYRFDFYDIDDNLVRTSGELIHNINNDSDYNYSTDRYICSDFIKPTEVYKLVYTVTTMNGYVGSSPRYKVTANTRLAPGRYMEIIPTPIIEDGCIDISCKGELGLSPEGKMEEALYYGEYVLSRASEEDGFTEWEQIQEFRLSNQKPSSFHFYDFSVKQGTKYIYAIQQFNMSKLYSTRILSPKVSVDFEDMFLFDGERSLKIRFNPKINSFKTTHLEKKIETIGNKYPFVFRNGAVGYKEFPVEGLISYHIDENQRFFKREELYNFYRQNEDTRKEAMNAKYIEYHRNTDLTEDNILLERKFKLAVLDWLNNGEPKLFKSATEGNYIVRLLNISLTPQDGLGRMLHTFKATAVEVAECNLNNLKKFGFAIGGAINTFVPLWRTYDFNSLNMSQDGRGKELEFEQEVSSFKIEGVLPRTKVYIYYSDSVVPEEIIIGATGAYSFSGSDRRVIKLVFAFENNLNIQGHIECEYMGRRYSNFDAITDIKLQTIISNQVIGVNPKLGFMKNSSPSFPNWELAIKSLADTNYRTYLNKYLVHIDIPKVLDGGTLSYTPEVNQWKEFLRLLDITDSQDKLKYDRSSFDPGETIQYIKTDFNDFNRNKLSILNMEQATIRQRPLIPVYVVPYEMVTPEAWRKMPNEIWPERNSQLGQSIFQKQKNPDGSFKEYYSREDYEKNHFPTWNLLFSTTPFGQPYPIDELITYLTLQIHEYEPMIDNHFIYVIYKYNKDKNTWELIPNKSTWSSGFSGCYYDPYHKELLEEYKTTFYINDKYRYDPIGKEDVIRMLDSVTGEVKYKLRADGVTILTRDILYIKENGEYIPALKDSLSAQDTTYRYKLWQDVKEPEYYYIQTENNIDIQYSREMKFEQIGEVDRFSISNGIISEQTFELQITDYYTEQNDRATKEAKDKYLAASKFLKEVFSTFDKIQEADVEQYKYNSLYLLYKTLLSGCNEGAKNHPLKAYDFLLMFIMLEEEFVNIEYIEKYFVPAVRLDSVYAPNFVDIEINLKRLVSKYKGDGKIPLITLIEEMFYTENVNLINAYNNRKNIFTTIYNQLGKYSELKLIPGEKEDLYSLMTDEKITGIEAKYLSLQQMHESITEEIVQKESEAAELAKEFKQVQDAVKKEYEDYNNALGKIAVVEWIKRLRELNMESDTLDFLTTMEAYYTEVANNTNIESQYQQEQLDKWRGFYRNNYDSVRGALEQIIVLSKIKDDNTDDQDLDRYLSDMIQNSLKQILVLSSQMEIIENTPYNGIEIITEEDLKGYPQRELDLTLYPYNQIYSSLMASRLLMLENDIIKGLDQAGGKVTEDNVKLIKIIQEYVLEVDNYELLLGFKNYQGENASPVLNIPINTRWIENRDTFIRNLPPSEMIKLERNILKINVSGEELEQVLKMGEEENEEPWYLFSEETNIKEYKKRLVLLLDVIRAVIKNTDLSEDIDELLNMTDISRGSRLKDLPGVIYGTEIEGMNEAIEDANLIITKYVQLLHSSDRIARGNKWNELIEEFNTQYPFESYLLGEPERYKEKINKAKDINTSAFDIAYDLEPLTERIEEETKYIYKLNEKIVLPASGEVNKDTFTATYRYFSDFYWKLIGEFTEDSGNGMLYWYIDVVLMGEIEFQRKVLEEMKILLEEYNIKKSNYNDKCETYFTKFQDAQLRFQGFERSVPDVFKYYFQSSGTQYELIDKAIQEAKKYWNLFILELDLGYKRELERGMYG